MLRERCGVLGFLRKQLLEQATMGNVQPVTLRGVCHFFSETGTEGGWWAFQDERFMGIRADHVKRCAKCDLQWNAETEPNGPRLIDLRRYSKRDRGYLRATAIRQRACHKKDAHEWILAYPDGHWTYEGLHVLHDGDILTIYDKANPRVREWHGVIALEPLPFFAAHIHGLRLRVDQKGIERERWAKFFFEKYPAELTLGPESLEQWENWKRKSVEKKLKELERA